MGLSMVVYMQTANSAEQKRLHLAQQNNFCSYTSNQGAFWARLGAEDASFVHKNRPVLHNDVVWKTTRFIFCAYLMAL
jgi:hypothetical protein